MRVRAPIVSCCVVLLVSLSSYGQIITLTGGSSGWLSVRGTDNSTDIQYPTIALPSSGNLSLTKPNVTASADYAFSDTGFVLSNVQYSLGAAGGVSSYADLYGQIQFTPNVDVTYTIDGIFNWSGDWANGVTLWARLQDVTNGVPGVDISNHYYNQTGVLSSASLAVTPGPGRPTTGSLQQGRIYEFDFELAVDNNRFSPATGTANGGVSISFVPEPGMLSLLVLGVLVVVGRARRTRLMSR